MSIQLLSMVMLLSGVMTPADPPAAPALLSGWHGTWAGTMRIAGPGDVSAVVVKLEIRPVLNARELHWVMTYGDGDAALVKDYRLVPSDEVAGRYQIDECNGVILDAWMVNDVLYSQFEVGGSLLTAREELRGDTIRFEVTSASPAAEKTGEGAVQGYDVRAVQTAVLKKQR